MAVISRLHMSSAEKVEEYYGEVGATWEQLKDAIVNGKLERIGRTAKCTASYAKERTEKKKFYNSSADALRIEFFKYDAVVCPLKGKITAAVPLDSSKIRRQHLTPNRFPYSMHPTSGIKHSVFWSLDPITQSDVDQLISKEFQGKDVIYYENPIHLKSVPDIHHVQVFCREAEGEQGEVIRKCF